MEEIKDFYCSVPTDNEVIFATQSPQRKLFAVKWLWECHYHTHLDNRQPVQLERKSMIWAEDSDHIYGILKKNFPFTFVELIHIVEHA